MDKIEKMKNNNSGLVKITDDGGVTKKVNSRGFGSCARDGDEATGN